MNCNSKLRYKKGFTWRNLIVVSVMAISFTGIASSTDEISKSKKYTILIDNDGCIWIIRVQQHTNNDITQHAYNKR